MENLRPRNLHNWPKVTEPSLRMRRALQPKLPGSLHLISLPELDLLLLSLLLKYNHVLLPPSPSSCFSCSFPKFACLPILSHSQSFLRITSRVVNMEWTWNGPYKVTVCSLVFCTPEWACPFHSPPQEQPHLSARPGLSNFSYSTNTTGVAAMA